ncbi:MAG: uL15m family ribosomal protein [Nanoarchaeota archaeon]
MPLKKLKKTRKVKKMRGKNMGTHGGGARKNNRKSGNRGGCGMAGSGKRSDHRKTLITKLYGNTYFGKQGITSRGTKKDKRKRINLKDIKEKYFKKQGEKIDLKNYKILGEGEGFKATLIAESASKKAIEKMKSAGGNIQVKEFKKEINKPEVTKPEEKK